MSTVSQSYLDDPIYSKVLEAFQSAAWESGLADLDRLIENYPDNPDLAQLSQEMKLRARIDADEIQDNRDLKKQKIRSGLVRSIILFIIIGLGYYAISTYSIWLGSQITAAQDRIRREMFTIELSVKFRNAQNLTQVGRLEDAQIIFQEVAQKDPEFPGLQEEIQRIETMISVDDEYKAAIAMMDQGKLVEALDAFEKLQAKEPYYKDVGVRITEIKNSFFLGDVMAKAEEAYETEDWVAAASSYETLRALDVTYQSELVDERLFECYMNAAIKLLADDDSLEALDIAEIYFRKALTLRPQDPVIQQEREQARETFKERLFTSYVNVAMTAITENTDSLEALAKANQYYQRALELRSADPEITRLRNLAQMFLMGQSEFAKGNWTETITLFEDLYAQEPNYANGTGRQILYDSYMARGSDRMQSTDFDLALADYQRAATLADEAPQSGIRLFQAQVSIAEIQGVLGDYETAVLVYSSAIDLADFSAAALQERYELRSKIEQAENNANAKLYRTAYRLYRDAARTIMFLFPTTEYVVQSGDYLAQIANRYNTTVQAILQVNSLNYSSAITSGKTLIIPVEQPEGTP